MNGYGNFGMSEFGKESTRIFGDLQQQMPDRRIWSVVAERRL
jgi:hypothetical protein